MSACSLARISVIVPTLNEAETIAQCLSRVQSAYEIIVVDGGSADSTSAIAEASGAIIVNSERSRGKQMNLGASVAGGDILFFIHADTLAPDDWQATIVDCLATSGVAAGAFQFALGPGPFYFRIIERLTNFRSKRLQMPYGDQGLFLRKSLFHRLGGFRNIPIMEDFDFVRLLRKRGKVKTVESPALTSARRWRSVGALRTTVINQLMIIGYFLGMPLDNLEKFYRGSQKRNRTEDR